jgi:hypothetical protein
MDLPFAIDADINAYFSKYSIKLRKKFEIYSQSKSKSFKKYIWDKKQSSKSWLESQFAKQVRVCEHFQIKAVVTVEVTVALGQVIPFSGLCMLLQ